MVMYSICAPFWERQEALTAMAEQYRTLYTDLPYEIVIADDGSSTPAVAPDDHVRIVHLPRKRGPKNPCVPINAAVRASKGEIIVLTNPEVNHLHYPVLRDMHAALGPKGAKRYVTAPCFEQRTKQWLAGPHVEYGTKGRGPTPPGAHFHWLAMMWRALWDEAGGFDERYRDGKGWDDTDWVWRVAATGAVFVCTGEEHAVCQPRSTTKWAMRSNQHLFETLWPPEKQRRIVQGPEPVRPRTLKGTPVPGVPHPQWAMVLGGGQGVWDDVVAWEMAYGKQWDGLIIAANDVGSHWPRVLHHWCTLHAEKMPNWIATRRRYGFPGEFQTWGRRVGKTRGAPTWIEHSVMPWGGGSSGLLAVQVARILGCTKIILCGIPMEAVPHFAESLVHASDKPWTSCAGHWRAWMKCKAKYQAWTRSMRGETRRMLGGPTRAWLEEEAPLET